MNIKDWQQDKASLLIKLGQSLAQFNKTISRNCAMNIES